MMLRLVSNGADADNLAQSAFVAAFVALDEFNLELRFSTWLYSSPSIFKDHLKSKKRGESALGSDEVCEATFAGRIAPADEADAGAGALRAGRSRAGHVVRRGSRAHRAQGRRGAAVCRDPRAHRRPVTALKIRAVRARARLRQALVKLAPRDILLIAERRRGTMRATLTCSSCALRSWRSPSCAIRARTPCAERRRRRTGRRRHRALRARRLRHQRLVRRQ